MKRGLVPTFIPTPWWVYCVLIRSSIEVMIERIALRYCLCPSLFRCLSFILTRPTFYNRSSACLRSKSKQRRRTVLRLYGCPSTPQVLWTVSGWLLRRLRYFLLPVEMTTKTARGTTIPWACQRPDTYLTIPHMVNDRRTVPFSSRWHTNQLPVERNSLPPSDWTDTLPSLPIFSWRSTPATRRALAVLRRAIPSMHVSAEPRTSRSGT